MSRLSDLNPKHDSARVAGDVRSRARVDRPMPSVLSCLSVAVLVLTLALLPIPAAADEAVASVDRPNILLILADDLGTEWLSCYGGESLDTPVLDQLAEAGMRFTSAYVMPQCTPTRVSLLTGQYPWRSGWLNHWDVPRWGSGCHFDSEEYTTFARILRSAGYATAAAGKWQVNDFRVQPDAMVQHGFDAYCMWTGYETGNEPSANRYWDPYLHTPEGSRQYPGQFGPDLFVDFFIEFMKGHRDQPMLMYYPMVLPHTPLTNTPLDRDAEGHLPRHKAMVRYIEHNVRRLTDALERLDLRERTIVIFTSDNGTVMGLEAIQDGRAVDGGKATLTEPGVWVPFILNAPGLVPAGVVTDALTDITDIFPTLIELAGVSMPQDHEVDGHSLAPLWLGETTESPRDWIMAMGFGPAAFRDGRVESVKQFADRVVRNERYKLWVENGRPSRLFDVLDDPGETRNLIDSDAQPIAEARRALEQAVAGMPERDASPRYRKMPVQPWDLHLPEPMRFSDQRPRDRRPDVLVILTDDQRHDAFGAAGDVNVLTPNMDRLAASGTHFTHCFIMGSTVPAVCMPSRASLMTGRHLSGLVNYGWDMPEEHAMLPEVLRRAGYTTFGTGKWHNERPAFARAFSAGDAIFFGGMSDHDKVPIWDFDPTGEYPNANRRIGKKFSSELFTDAAIGFLEQHSDDRPLFMYVSYTSPHDPFMAPKPYADLYHPLDKLQLPPNVMPQHPFDNGELWIRDELLAPFPRTSAIVAAHLAGYYGMISELDVQVGRLLRAWEQRGRAGESLIVFTSDNGLAVGQHGLLGKQSLYDHSVRVPLILAGAGIEADRRIDALCYFHDIFPTITDWLELDTPDTVQSESLVPLLRDPDARGRESLYLAYRDFQRGLRQDRFKLIQYNVNGERTTQLFDLEADPWEMRNPADDPRHRDRVRQLSSQLVDAMREMNDPADPGNFSD